MTLATMRTYIWRTGNDLSLFYKANGKREIPVQTPEAPPQDPASETSGEQANTEPKASAMGTSKFETGLAVTTSGSTPTSRSVSASASTTGPIEL